MIDREEPSDGERLGSLFAAVRDLDPERQATFLDRNCPDPRLRSEVESLLRRAVRAERLFEALGASLAAITREITTAASASDGDVHHPDSAPTHEAPPEPGSKAAIPAGDGLVERTVSHYRIEERLGGGGMGIVYRARDLRLDRVVALKFLPPHLSLDDVAKQRFLAEARAAAALDHPNICTVYEIDETEEKRLFIAMACYEGETLRARIARGPLSVEDAARIARRIARGLAAAHARGIVHRDIKPANVMLLEDGGVILLDFGLAKVADVTLTQPGLTPGTVAYMSPEQVRGEGVDPRTDLWSLGVIIYEMLIGRRPFGDARDAVVLHGILHREPESLHERRPETPERLAAIVDRLLEKRPERRYPSAEAVLAALSSVSSADAPEQTRGLDRYAAFDDRAAGRERHRRRSRTRDSLRTKNGRRRASLAAAALLVGGIGGAILWLTTVSSQVELRGPAEAPRRILIADFTNLSSDSLLGDAVSQALRMDLSGSPLLSVAGGGTVAAALERMRREPDSRLDAPLAREVAVREGIPLVIEGEVRHAGSGLVISAAIVDAGSGEVLDGWRERAPDSAHVLDAIDRLSKAIRGRMTATISSTDTAESLERFTTSSLEALRSQAQGSRLFLRGDYLRAAALFREATRLDSSFAKAHADVAWSLLQAGIDRGQALRALATAYELRDRLPLRERHDIVARYLRLVAGDLEGAIEGFTKQVEMARLLGEPQTYASLGSSLVLVGDLAAAESVLREAWSTYPTPVNQGTLVKVLYRRGKEAEAEATLHRAVERFPDHPLLQRLQAELAATRGEWAIADSLAGHLPAGGSVAASHRQLGLLALLRGRLDEATGHLRALVESQLSRGLHADALEVAAALGRIDLLRGETERATRDVDELLDRHPLATLDPLDRPYLPLARFLADAGQPARARGLLAAYDREVPAAFRGPDSWAYLRARAAIHLAEARAEEALADLRSARAHPPIHAEWFKDPYVPSREFPELGLAYERMGMPDSAVTAHERYVKEPTLVVTERAFDLARTLSDLAELHEARGDRHAAARYYTRFGALWGEADAELQPRVREARRRADLLRGSGNVRDRAGGQRP